MRYGGWKAALLFAFLLLTAPILMMLLRIIDIEATEIAALAQNLLPTYLQNTVVILTGVSILSMVLALPAAWYVSTSNFPGSRLFEWLLILPISIPTFISAIAYAGLTDFAGPIRSWLRKSAILPDIYMDIMTPFGVIFVMSVVLYPYVFLTARTAFVMQSGSLIEVSRTLGLSSAKLFWRVALPISWPLIFSGLSLIMMEVLNDYGTVGYYGVPTFTSGIFRSWLSLGNLSGAIFLSTCLMVFVFLILTFEEYLRGRKKYTENNRSGPPSGHRLHGWQMWGAVVACLIPLLLGFVVPGAQLVFWLALIWNDIDWSSFLGISANTLLLASLSSLIVVTFAIVQGFAIRMSRSGKALNYVAKVGLLGYATPGAVVGVGIIIIILAINPNWIYLGISALVYGYCVRYFAAGFNPVEGGMKKVSENLDDAALSLGIPSYRVLQRLIVPLIKPALATAMIMVFVDVCKELPLTLILRPFNYETLATNAFQFAKDERAIQSAPASILIVALGILPVYFLNRSIRALAR